LLPRSGSPVRTWTMQSPRSSTSKDDSDDASSSHRARYSSTLGRALAKFGGLPSDTSPSTRSQSEDTSEAASEDASYRSMDTNTPVTALSGHTTVMLKNVPVKYTSRKLLRELLAAGFQGQMDFMYLPIDPRTRSPRGFAFCNFTTPQAAEQFYHSFHRRYLKSHCSEPLEVAVAEVQGFEANAEHYFEVKASRKEKGRDTLGCPVFLRPLPPQLLAYCRDLESAQDDNPLGPAPVGNWHVRVEQPGTSSACAVPSPKLPQPRQPLQQCGQLVHPAPPSRPLEGFPATHAITSPPSGGSSSSFWL